MLIITVKLDALVEDTQGVKEAVAMLLEPLGEVRVVSVTGEEPEQIQFDM